MNIEKAQRNAKKNVIRGKMSCYFSILEVDTPVVMQLLVGWPLPP
jgi:hypothetical protein